MTPESFVTLLIVAWLGLAGVTLWAFLRVPRRRRTPATQGTASRKPASRTAATASSAAQLKPPCRPVTAGRRAGKPQQQIGRQHGEREKTHDVTQHPDSCQSFHP